jgi:hypothetical protein
MTVVNEKTKFSDDDGKDINHVIVEPDWKVKQWYLLLIASVTEANTDFRKIHGQVQYVSLVIPCMRFLMTPLNQRLSQPDHPVGLGKGSKIRKVLKRMAHIMDLAEARPAHINGGGPAPPPALPWHLGCRCHWGQWSVAPWDPFHLADCMAPQMATRHQTGGAGGKDQHGGLRVRGLLCPRVPPRPPAEKPSGQGVHPQFLGQQHPNGRPDHPSHQQGRISLHRRNATLPRHTAAHHQERPGRLHPLHQKPK